ncbi:hypothetical protein [Pseudoalteromonas sp. SCQQ13]|uniref:hypothetical protein n=1 Tax=Pseudoalteromonas sp. SCQQ13 TaxID=2792066 RepID=UPI0018CFE07B|nr:hypothetical protein [Pseudoalteromonas sp. SCQQ13]MBH0093443.1 hypothetical protein [Pseudoalteromonas sp. SCQQ13]
MSDYISIAVSNTHLSDEKNNNHYSKGIRELTFEDNRGFSTCVRVPDEINSVLCDIFMAYLSSPIFAKYAKGTQTNYASYVIYFFNFLSQYQYTNDQRIPNSVLSEFVQYLKSSNAGSTIIRHSNLFITKVIRHTALDTDNALDSSHKERFWQYLSKAVKIQSVESNPIKSMSAYFNTGYSDTELIRSLRITCTWILLEHDRQRKLLLDDSKIETQLALLKTFPVDAPPLNAGRLYAGNIKKLTKNIIKEVKLSQNAYTVLLKSVLKTNDGMLFERVIAGFKHKLGKVLSQDTCQTVIERMFGLGLKSQKAKIVSNIRLPKHIATNQRMVITWMKSLTYRHLIAPSEVEIFAAQCIFASERIQASNQARQTLNDIEFNSDGLQIQHVKNRSKNTYASGIYGHNTLINSALRAYVDSCLSWKQWANNKDGDLLFPYSGSSNTQRRGVIGRYKSSNWSFFELLVTPGTSTNNKLINDVSKNDSEPFIQWLSALIKHNSAVLSKNAEKGCLGLSISMIGQSRNYMESSLTVVEKGSDEPLTSDDPNISSSLRGHSLSTRRRIYDDRAPKKSVDYDFATRVAELMEQDAEKIGQYLKKTKVVNLIEAKQLLGCENVQDDMRAILQEVEADIGLTGEIQNGKETIFVANELTAALLYLRISHINNEIPKLLNDTPSYSKALNAASKRVYLEKVLSQFPSPIVKAGKMLSQTLNVQFESLI